MIIDWTAKSYNDTIRTAQPMTIWVFTAGGAGAGGGGGGEASSGIRQILRLRRRWRRRRG